MQRIKKTLYISIIVFSFTVNPLFNIFNTGLEETYAATFEIPAKYQTEITKIKNEQTEKESMVSQHTSVKKNGQTIIKMLEIPEYQLSNIIGQWEQQGNEINNNTINNNEFIEYLINHTDIKSYSYTARIPKLYFLVKNEIAEPILYGGEIKKFFKSIIFTGWFKIAGALDAQGNYRKGYEHLGTQKTALVELFEGVLSKTAKGSYTIVELYTDENGERKGKFKFFNTPDQSEPTFVQPIDAMAAYVLTYLNLVPDNPDDIDVKKDLTKPIVERLIAKAKAGLQDKVASSTYINQPETSPKLVLN
ncbi:MAG: hypothetical protein ACYSTS_16165 [Planctomycetota bacterium]|jgi:hypothetical protein